MSHLNYKLNDVTIENLPYGTWEDDVVKLLNESLPGCAKKFSESNIQFKTNLTTATVKITPGHNPLDVLFLNGRVYEGHVLNVYTDLELDLQHDQELPQIESKDFKSVMEFPIKSTNNISKRSKSWRTSTIIPPANTLPVKPQKRSKKPKLDQKLHRTESSGSKYLIEIHRKSNEINRSLKVEVEQPKTLEIIPPVNILYQKPAGSNMLKKQLPPDYTNDSVTNKLPNWIQCQMRRIIFKEPCDDTIAGTLATTSPQRQESLVGTSTTTAPQKQESLVGTSTSTAPQKQESLVGTSTTTAPQRQESLVGTLTSTVPQGQESLVSGMRAKLSDILYNALLAKLKSASS